MGLLNIIETNDVFFYLSLGFIFARSLNAFNCANAEKMERIQFSIDISNNIHEIHIEIEIERGEMEEVK